MMGMISPDTVTTAGFVADALADADEITSSSEDSTFNMTPVL